MHYTFHHLDEQQTLLVKVSGEYMLSNQLDYLTDLYQAYKNCDSDRILVDYSESNVEIGIIEAFNRPDVYDSFTPTRRPKKIGLVFRELTDNYRFFENVCRNRGWNIRIFDDADSATGWVTEVDSA